MGCPRMRRDTQRSHRSGEEAHLGHISRVTRSLPCRCLEKGQMIGWGWAAQCSGLTMPLFTGPGCRDNWRSLGPWLGHSGATCGSGSCRTASGPAQFRWGGPGQEVREELCLCPSRRKWGLLSSPRGRMRSQALHLNPWGWIPSHKGAVSVGGGSISLSLLS